MKFSCERCGKKYATAETPAPGRVYKLKCKACGHLIVVRAAIGAAAATAAQADASEGMSAPPPVPAPRPEIELEIDVPEPAAPSNGASAGAPPEFGDPMAAAPAASPPAEEEVEAPAGDAGYVDLFSDLDGSGAAAAEEQRNDPFLAAARASLPETYGTGGAAPDPFGPLLQDGRSDAPRATPPAVPKLPVIPKPPPQKIGLPIALIGGGVAVLIGILAFVLLGSGKKAPAASAQPARVHAQAAPTAPAPVAPVAPAQEPRPEVEQPPPAPPPAPAAAPEPRRSAGDDRRAREERRRRERDEAQARDARARETRERERAERERRAREERVAAAAKEDSGALSEAQIESVVRSTRKAFDGCLENARAGGVKLDGRRVMLRLNIQPSGTVTYPTLDDVTLNGTDLGSCLKSAARLMVFPKFKGDTLHVEVPIVVR